MENKYVTCLHNKNATATFQRNQRRIASIAAARRISSSRAIFGRVINETNNERNIFDV